jgi:peptidylprolyl isomerase
MYERPGIVRYVGSGRVQLDFNHRFAGRTLTYDVNILKKLETDDEKIVSLVRRRLPIDKDKIKFKLVDSTLEIELPEETFLSEGLQIIKRAIANDIFKFVNAVSNIKFIEGYKPLQPQPQQQLKAEEKPVQSTENKRE